MNPDDVSVLAAQGPAEPLAARELPASPTDAEHRPRPQLVGGLTDTVFGLSITLLATSLSVPQHGITERGHASPG